MSINRNRYLQQDTTCYKLIMVKVNSQEYLHTTGYNMLQTYDIKGQLTEQMHTTGYILQTYDIKCQLTGIDACNRIHATNL